MDLTAPAARTDFILTAIEPIFFKIICVQSVKSVFQSNYMFLNFNLKLLLTTVIELMAMAALATMGCIIKPKL